MRALFATALFLLLSFAALPTAAQDVEPAPEARPSPMALSAMTVGDTYMKVVYGSPRMRDRVIFGGLVPYGEVWRTGANEATEILFTEDVMFAGKHVDAGIYSMFTIPGEEEWTIILNGALGQWGAFSHDPEADILRVDVEADASAKTYEAFTMTFMEDGEDAATLRLNWADTQVDIPIAPME